FPTVSCCRAESRLGRTQLRTFYGLIPSTQRSSIASALISTRSLADTPSPKPGHPFRRSRVLQLKYRQSSSLSRHENHHHHCSHFAWACVCLLRIEHHFPV